MNTHLKNIGKMIIPALLMAFSLASASDSYQEKVLFTPGAGILLAEAKGRVMISDQMDNETIELAHNNQYPDWFVDSNYDLQDELESTLSNDKKGLMVVFSVPDCSYCLHFSHETLHNAEIANKILENFNAVHIDLSKDTKIITPDSQMMTIKQFGRSEGAVGTPAVYFYGASGKRLFRTMGFQASDRFKHILDYVAGEHYLESSLRSYITTVENETLENLDGPAEDLPLAPIPYVPDPCPACGEAAEELLLPT